MDETTNYFLEEIKQNKLMSKSIVQMLKLNTFFV